MNNDVYRMERGVVGFSKIPDEDGAYLEEVTYVLKPIDLKLLHQIFVAKEGDAGLKESYSIDVKQAKALQPYVINGVIDLDKYDFVLDCWCPKGWVWLDSSPKKLYSLTKFQEILKTGIEDIELFSYSFREIAADTDDINLLLDLLQQTKKFNDVNIRGARIGVLIKMLNKNVVLDEDFLFNLIVEGLTDPDENVNRKAKYAANKLAKKNINLALYERIKAQYDLKIWPDDD